MRYTLRIAALTVGDTLDHGRIQRCVEVIPHDSYRRRIGALYETYRMNSGPGDHLAMGLMRHVFYLQVALYYTAFIKDSLLKDYYTP